MEEGRPCIKSEDAQDERGRARLSYQQAEALPRAAFRPRRLSQWLRLSARLCDSMSDYERLAGAL